MTLQTPSLTPSDIVADVLASRPGSLAVFIRRRMACAGCVMAPMMTLSEAAEAYGFPVTQLIADIEAVSA